MNLLRKFRETALSVIPIVVIVVILNLTIAPVGWPAVGQFALGAVSIIVGLSLFLLGTDIGIVPVGQRTGAALMQKRNLPLLLTSGFIIGLIITIAEPQVQVLAQQVSLLAPHVSRNSLVLAISLGVGLFVSIAFARIVLAVSYRWVLIGFYAIVAILSILVDTFFLGIAFDAGGATTGPMTVPFILALGVGVAAVRKSGSSEQDSFGLVGIASIGPISAVLVMGLIGKASVEGDPGRNGNRSHVLRFGSGKPHRLERTRSLSGLGTVGTLVHPVPIHPVAPTAAATDQDGRRPGLCRNRIGTLLDRDQWSVHADRFHHRIVDRCFPLPVDIDSHRHVPRGGRSPGRAGRLGIDRPGPRCFRWFHQKIAGTRILLDRCLSGSGSRHGEDRIPAAPILFPDPRLCAGTAVDVPLSSTVHRHSLRFGWSRLGPHVQFLPACLLVGGFGSSWG